ncbi:hypothetical protein ACFLT1_02660 [Bacteroidota bacterium]
MEKDNNYYEVRIEVLDEKIEKSVKKIAKLLDVKYSDELKNELGRLIGFTFIQFEMTLEKTSMILEDSLPKEYKKK